MRPVYRRATPYARNEPTSHLTNAGKNPGEVHGQTDKHTYGKQLNDVDP